jgi:hypothetical protein
MYLLAEADSNISFQHCFQERYGLADKRDQRIHNVPIHFPGFEYFARWHKNRNTEHYQQNEPNDFHPSTP